MPSEQPASSLALPDLPATIAAATPTANRAVAAAAPGPLAPAIGQPLSSLLSPQALAGLAVTAAAVPPRLWRRVLVDPVEELLRRPGKGFRGRLTEIAYHLAGGCGSPPPALAAMLEVVHAGSMIIDDIEDDSRDRRGGPAVHRLHGLPIALNAGNWMYFAPYQLLECLGLEPGAELHLHRRMSRVLLDCHAGQALDLGARPGQVTQAQIGAVVATISTLKTGRLLALAAEAGAIAAGAGPGPAGALGEFGQALGTGLQMLDDLGNLSGRAPPDKRYEDLRCGRVTWPWAWAAELLEEPAWTAMVAERDRLAAEEPQAAPGRSGSAHWQPMALRLRGLVGAHGRLTTHWHLRGALSRLRAALPQAPTPVLDAIEREIERLEASYV